MQKSDVWIRPNIAFSLLQSGSLLLFLDAAPGVHHQSQGDNAVGDEHTEIFTDCSVAEEVLTGRGCHDKQQVEQHTTHHCLGIGSLLDGSAANQDGCTGIQTDLLMGTVGLEGAHVLDEDQLT